VIKRGPALLVGCGWIGLRGEELLHLLRRAARSSEVERGLTRLVLGGDVGAGSEQDLEALSLARARAAEKRRVAGLLVGSLEVGSSLDEHLDGLRLAETGSPDQRGPAVVVGP